MNLELNKKKKQLRLHVTFRDNKEEIELYNFIVEQSKIGGVSNYLKQLAFNDMKEKEGNK